MIKNIEIKPGCIACKNCETICPSIFNVKKASQVISERYGEHWQEILQAEAMCPVQVIDVEKTEVMHLHYKKATILEKTMLTPDTLELVFQTENFAFYPGQYVSLQMEDWRGKFARSYSIANTTVDTFTLTVKILDMGRGGRYLKKARRGKKIKFLGPNGDFVLQNTMKPKVFIATGTGLAPMISMLQNTPDEVEKTVIFGVRYSQDVYYKEKLESFPNTKVIIAVSRPDDSWKGHTGRVNKHIEGISRESEIYICGAPAMIDYVTKYLRAEGYHEDQIFHESFTISTHKHQDFVHEVFYNGDIPGLHWLSIGVIGLSLGVFPFLLYGATQEVKDIFWLVSWWTAFFVMIIRPLADVFPKLGVFRTLVILRKPFGIMTASVIVYSLLFGVLQNPGFFESYFQASSWGLERRALFGRLTEITGVLLLITSNTFSQRLLGIWWKRIQRTAYIYFFAGGYFAVQYGGEIGYYGSMILVAVFWILAQMNIKIHK